MPKWILVFGICYSHASQPTPGCDQSGFLTQKIYRERNTKKVSKTWCKIRDRDRQDRTRKVVFTRAAAGKQGKENNGQERENDGNTVVVKSRRERCSPFLGHGNLGLCGKAKNS
jgi:hypothetical protein